MTTPLRTAEAMRECVANQIADDIKQNKKAIDDLVHALILDMEESMIDNREYTDCIGEYDFNDLPYSCRHYAIQLTEDKLLELGYTVTRDANDLEVTCATK